MGGVVLADNTIEGYLSRIGLDDEKIPFYRHGIKENGHIVGIDVASDEAERAATVLADAGGTVPQTE